MNFGRVVVVGAGVSGLTTAIVLAEAGHNVHVIASELPGATSLAAGAMWGPYLVEPKDKVDQWSRESLQTFRELAAHPGTGVRLTSGIEASRTAQNPPDWAAELPGFRPCPRAELPQGFTSGYRFTVPLIDMPAYLGFLRHQLEVVGVAIELRTLSSLEEAQPAATIVNCTGLSARSLADDPRLRSIRGQQVVVTNPGLTEFFSEDTGISPDLLCIYPHGDVAVLGGTAIDGDESLKVDHQAAEAILARCRAVEPRLAQARVLSHRVGLRPTRDHVRVEADPVADRSLLHNYGHGGAGVTLSWGCAYQIRDLVGPPR
ncbi:FAD-binding oxidoreductase [Nonomuraea glycinis]|uniref:D-amino-acid oxidase n=1 Tax=Nonomuraea glycinis TaxID=2047744 RepID=A0A918E956_9ACTN|nr:FAD-dependent oxidoreductase [Nonomuraea glycinis]MCA2178463.1 FAD-binding oxidoreductase [Nonomuraea glycinis]GGP14166.1 amino acid oxidase [Nonomuraea glycinis]